MKPDPKPKKDQTMPTTSSASNGNYGTNYAVLEWDGGQWLVREDCCNYGCVPTEPDSPGAYPGQTTVTSCEPQYERMPLPPSLDS
jgi:hypothetical protein